MLPNSKKCSKYYIITQKQISRKHILNTKFSLKNMVEKDTITVIMNWI